MGQDFNIGIIGAGPAGCCCAYYALKRGLDVTLIDFKNPLSTILPTGGGRCNFAHSEFDFKELASNYPRGKKFLYSIFSQFSTSDTLDMFDELGINYYISDDGRIFPTSNDSKEVRVKFLAKLKLCRIIKERALRIEKEDDRFKVVTDMGAYKFNKLVCSIGGHAGYDLVKRLVVSIDDTKPSLVGLVTKENFSGLMGVAIKNLYNNDYGISGDVLFTHFGVSGPLIYKLSSIKAFDSMPYSLSFDFIQKLDDFQSVLNNNPHKYLKNILSEYMPSKFSDYVLTKLGVDKDMTAHNLNGQTRDIILDYLHNFKVNVKSTQKDGETVTAGGVNLDKISSKTMESKEVEGLYFCGEVINVDGFCGGFNLQNCWSTGYVCAQAL